MSNSCKCCGISIPNGQKFCSMCYGDPAYGRDGYYEAEIRAAEQRQWEQEEAGEAQMRRMEETRG